MMAAETTASEWTLRSLLSGLADEALLDDRTISGISADSRRLTPGAVFFACSGDMLVAQEHMREALAKGAAAIITASDTLKSQAVPVVHVADIVSCLGATADRFFGEPSRAMKMVGVTGTNGKTSVSHYIAQGLQSGGGTCGLLGTLGYGLYGSLEPGVLTTPDVLSVHARLAQLQSLGARQAVMEVSSHGLEQGRVAGVAFDVAVFTNLSRDHLDYHADMRAYGEAKRKLFMTHGLGAAIVNADDPFGRSLIDELPASLEIFAYGLDRVRDSFHDTPTVTPVCGRVIAAHRDSLTLGVHTPSAEADFCAPLLGTFNASNLLAALCTLLASGLDLDEAARALSDLRPVPGRMERFGGDAGSPLVVVDYSHTPDSLANALQALREQLDGTLWCVFGAGGDRDRGKRCDMGAAAVSLADQVILTDDNPRGEDGDRIIEDIRTGISSDFEVLTIRDRGAAISYAIQHAGPHDSVLVAGKGHEPYQEVAGVRHPFSDAAVARVALRERQR